MNLLTSISNWFRHGKAGTATPDAPVPSDPPAAPSLTPPKTGNRQLTREMVYQLKEFVRFPKHYCFRCDQRNGIDNVFFCLDCGEVCCWQCIRQREERVDPSDGKMHHVCRCGNYLKLWDEWRKQAGKAFPDEFGRPDSVR